MLAIISFEDLKIALKDTGRILMLASSSFLIPFLWALAEFFYSENFFPLTVFGLTGLLCYLSGFVLKNLFLGEKTAELKHAVLVTGFVWLVFPFFAGLPFFFVLGSNMLDSYFEAMSSVTTTGLSILQSLFDSAPGSIVLWRSLIGWFGGIGIIALALIGVFGSYTNQTVLAIAEGRNERLTPSIKKSILMIWKIYFGLTVFGAALLWLSGMTPFDAINYSMSAISTNGMATTSTGLNVEHAGWENFGNRNYWVDLSLVLIMLFGATSFAVHYTFFKKNDWSAYTKNQEFVALVVAGLIGGLLVLPKLGVESGFFHNFSALTTGGIAFSSTAETSVWGDSAKMVLALAMIVGTASASTGGGIKIGRILLFLKSVWWKSRELISSNNIFFPKKFQEKPVSERDLKEIYLFILLYFFILMFSVLVLVFNGAGFTDSFFEVASAQGNAGLSVGITKMGMPVASEIALILSMWVGRLEIMPFLALLGAGLSAVLPSKIRNA